MSDRASALRYLKAAADTMPLDSFFKFVAGETGKADMVLFTRHGDADGEQEAVLPRQTEAHLV